MFPINFLAPFLQHFGHIGEEEGEEGEEEGEEGE